ncbi:ubiquinol-cytochrome c reductase core subunit 1 [Tulasnella sp. 419]|nr:ubiquinol-cytochrome c reductase core subunit 1 [Tulasnella sp. 419]
MLSSTIRASRARTFATAASSGALNVAAVSRGQPTSSVTVFVKAGSRYETQPGAAQFLKNFAFKDTAKRSSLRQIRETELYGGVLSTSLSREHLAITADFLPGNEDYFVDLLSSVLTSTRFAPHELQEEVGPSVLSETTRAYNDPATHALDLAHLVAFRSGLGTSIFASPQNPVSAEQVKDYASKVFTKGNVAFVGTGVDQEVLEKLVAQHFGKAASSSAVSSTPTKYFGGETRAAPAPESHAHGPQTVFIGYGVASPSAPEMDILSAILDTTPSIKWSKPTTSFASSIPHGTHVKPVVLRYSDASLFGVIVQSHSVDGVKSAAANVVKTLKEAGSGSLKDDEVTKAIAKAKFSLASSAEQKDALVAGIASKLLFGAEVSAEASTAALDSFAPSNFAKATSKLVSSKPVFVAVGDVGRLPYADELGL